MKHWQTISMDCPPFLPSGGLRRAGNPGGECRWDTFHHEGDNVQLSLGMTQAEVEDKLLRQRVPLPRRTRTR